MPKAMDHSIPHLVEIPWRMRAAQPIDNLFSGAFALQENFDAATRIPSQTMTGGVISKTLIHLNIISACFQGAIIFLGRPITTC
jgi:hypothetical protein